jgi:peptidoglycan/xylan/chitin deacetylase (PgdA/CDA1 family)
MTSTRLLISIDTEVHVSDPVADSPLTQIHGAVTSGREYGISYIMDSLDERRLKATFFLSVFDSLKWGADGYRDIARGIVDRGFDVQLHTHLDDLSDASLRTKQLGDLPFEQQCLLLRDGAELLAQWTGKRPTWHRAGNLAATRDTLRACRAANLRGDSSFAFGWPQSSDLGIGRERRNDVQWLEGIVEMPVTTFRTMPALDNFRYLELRACTLGELRAVTLQAVRRRVPYLVFVMHSFSLVRRIGGAYQAAKADLDRFHRYLDFVASEPGLSVVTFDSVDTHHIAGSAAPESPGGDLEAGVLLTYARAWEHRKRGWKNRVFLLAPLAASVLALGALSWLP